MAEDEDRSQRVARDQIALFLDFDGTLVDIAARPDAVMVRPEIPALLQRLRQTCGGALAIVTGRPVAEIDHFLPNLDLDVCGLHGLERRVAMRMLPLPPLPDLSGEIASLRVRLRQHPGIVVEDKTVGAAVHWRMEPAAEAEARAAIDDLASRVLATHRIQDGKSVRELVPLQAGKGAGIRALMVLEPYRGRMPVFVGDDRTDEDGFGATVALGGIGLKVGPGDTLAQRRVDGTRQLRVTLEDWLQGSAGPAEWGGPAQAGCATSGKLDGN